MKNKNFSTFNLILFILSHVFLKISVLLVNDLILIITKV